jgi:hypothetical protein
MFYRSSVDCPVCAWFWLGKAQTVQSTLGFGWEGADCPVYAWFWLGKAQTVQSTLGFGWGRRRLSSLRLVLVGKDSLRLVLVGGRRRLDSLRYVLPGPRTISNPPEIAGVAIIASPIGFTARSS